MEQGDTESLPPRPMEIMQAELEALRGRVESLDSSLQAVVARGDAVQAVIEQAQESVAKIEASLEATLERLGVASAAIADTSASLQASIADTEQAAADARKLTEQAVLAGPVDAAAGRLLVWQQAPAWVLGIGVLALAFYLVYARIGSAGPWIAVGVGLVMSVALSFRQRLWPPQGQSPSAGD